MCPVGTEPVLAFEYKWWNTMPSNMKSFVIHQHFSQSEVSTGEAPTEQLGSENYPESSEDIK